jgi:hypothetical protein
MQFTGHDAELQVCDCVPPFSAPYVVVHDTPPDDAAVDWEKVRGCLPLPHVKEQLPQLSHAPTQFAGHDAVLQFCDCVPPFSAPYVVVHDTPPNDAAADCQKVRAWLPLPHVLEQLPQLPHVPTQFTGHVAELQFCDSVPLFSPPYVVVQDTPP